MVLDVWETPQINHKTIKSIHLGWEESESYIWLGGPWKRQKGSHQYSKYSLKETAPSHSNDDKRKEIVSLLIVIVIKA